MDTARCSSSVLVAVVAGCGPAVADDIAGSTSAAEVSSAPSSSPGTGGTTSVAPSSSGGDSSGEWASSSDGGSFLIDPPGCGEALPETGLHCNGKCSLVDQNCPTGEACKPWSDDGSDVWGASRCTPVSPEPAQLGEPCHVEGSATTGIDSCDVGLMCWNVDARMSEGTCVQFCGGTDSDPLCGIAEETCSIANHGVLPLCLPRCDPLTSTCEPGFGCYPGSGGDFVCIREGEPVHLDVFHPECPAGTFWANPAEVEGCVDGEPCCAAFCDVTDPEACGPDADCLSYVQGELPEVDPLGYCDVASEVGP